MNDPSDETLYARYRKGDDAAFEALYRRYRQPLYLFLLRSVASAADADDLFQELWTRVIHARESFTEGSVRAWLFRIARNLRIDLFRRRGLRPVGDTPAIALAAATTPLPDRQIHDMDCEKRLLAEIDRLPEAQKDAFLLKEEAGLALEDIGRLTGVGRETVKSRLRYAMTRLRQALEDCL